MSNSNFIFLSIAGTGPCSSVLMLPKSGVNNGDRDCVACGDENIYYPNLYRKGLLTLVLHDRFFSISSAK